MGEPKIAKKAKDSKLLDTSVCTSLPQDPAETFEHASQSFLIMTSDDSTADEHLPKRQTICLPTTSTTGTTSNKILALESIPNNKAAPQSRSISTAISALSEPLTEFTLFPKLPLELRFKVFNLALSPQSVYISRSRLVIGRQAISLACKEFKQEYERQYKVLKKRASDLRPRFGPIFINYSMDYVHFFHTGFEDYITWAGIMDNKVRHRFDLIQWMKPAQRVAIGLRQRSGNQGLCAPKVIYNRVWEQFSKMCPEMKELIFVIADRDYPREDLVELKNFSGQVGLGEVALRNSFEAAQNLGFNVSAKLVVMGSSRDWIVSKGKTVEIVDMSG
ncbi:hypothetical protein IFR05_013085 [Cadophora sp. M221]|nr:hypothetical protein IFR05_013085 [Cadophora sp. M221]